MMSKVAKVYFEVTTCYIQIFMVLYLNAMNSNNLSRLSIKETWTPPDQIVVIKYWQIMQENRKM